VSDKGRLVGRTNELLSKLTDSLDDLGAVFVYPWPSLKDVRWPGGIGDGIHMFVVNIPFSDGEFNGMGNGEGMGGVDGSKIDGCLELESMGEVTRFNLFYES